MSVWPNDYVEKVLDDVKKYEGIRKIVKAGLIERSLKTHCAPERLHPNPSDEFSQDQIGPNLEIVGNYVKEIHYNLFWHLPIFKEPVIVQKMKPDGYILLNGHHRWFAALRMGIKKLHIKIVNMINEEDLNRMISEAVNDKLVSFDFDEVLLAADDGDKAAVKNSLFSRKIKERLRLGAPEIIKTFKDKGYDVCVYSANYFSEDDFNDFFSMYDLKVDLIVNGINEKRGNTEKIKELLKDRYKSIVHVDNEMVVFSNHISKTYEIFEIKDTGKQWEDGIKEIVDSNEQA